MLSWAIDLFTLRELMTFDISTNSSDGRMIRASDSEAVDSVLLPTRVKPMILKLVFTASLLDAQQCEGQWRQVYLCRWERHLAEFPHLSVVERWLATPKGARIAH